MTSESLFEVDIEELRAAGNALLGAGDELQAGAPGAMGSRRYFGNGTLERAAGRFADRFTYLVDGLGDDVVGQGHSLRGYAYGYEEMDATVAARFLAVGADHP